MAIEEEKSTTNQKIYKPFQFLGNEGGCKVAKYNPALGDGDISTGGGGKVLTTVQANLSKISTTKVRLTLIYNVWESSWEQKGKTKADRLYFTGTMDIDLKEFYKNSITKNGVQEITEVWNWSLPTLQEAYYKDYYNTKDKRHGWLTVNPKSYPAENRTQSWLPVGELQVKIDDSGSELTKAGNIGVKGYVSFTIRVDKKKTIFTPDEVVNSQKAMGLTKGSFLKLPQIDPGVRTVLGRGYDITGKYADTASLCDPVFDLDKLNEWNRLEKNPNASYEGRKVYGSGVEEYTSKFASSLNVKVAAAAFGVVFSSETTKTFSKESYEKSGYKFSTIVDVHRVATYKIQGHRTPGDIVGFLTERFKSDLNTMTADALVKKYGTHVLLGMAWGARVNYNMSYRQSISSLSTAKTFSSTTSISYNMKDNEVRETKPADSAAKKLFDKVVSLGNLKDSNTVEAMAKLAKEIDGNVKSQGKSSSGSGIGASTSVTYTESSSEDSKKEMESTEISCDGAGGNIHLIKEIQEDPTKYREWLNSLNTNNYCWCDFVNETLVPLYELVPVGHRISAQQVKTAWEKYLISKGKRTVPVGSKVVRYPFEAKGSSKKSINLDEERGGSNDREISTQSGKTTGWKVRVEAMNLDGGKVAVGLWLTVGEGGLNAGRSLLQLRDVIEIPSGSEILGVDSSGKTFGEFEGKIVGKNHNWIDVTDTAKGCPLFDTMGARVYVKLDGSGVDHSNIGVKGCLKVPCLRYT